MITQVFSSQSSDGQSTIVALTGGVVYVDASGTFGSGTVTVQLDFGDSTWRTYTSKNLTADGIIEVNGRAGMRLRLDLSGATTPNLNATVRH